MSSSFRRGGLIAAIALLLATNAALATAQNAQNDQQVAKAAVDTETATSKADAAPVLKQYRGVTIGMPVKEARASVAQYLKSKGDQQDILAFSDTEKAQIYYDAAGKVMAVSIDYFVKDGKAPTPMEVLGIDVAAKPDGSMYAIKRYPGAGYWVSYNRTSGGSPIVTITMQALR